MSYYLRLIKENKLTFSYLLLLVVVPLGFSSMVILTITENYSFFQNLQLSERCLMFFVFSFTMAFALTPTSFICLLSGFIWGWESLAYILPAYMLAQITGFQIAKLLNGQRLLNSLKELNKMPAFLSQIEQNQAKIIFLSRLSPVLPFALMNVVLSILQVDFKKFVLFGLLGMLPRSVFVIWLGTQAHDLESGLDGNWPYKIGLFLLTVLTIWGIGRVLNKKAS
jgi:uncharacterized membrane protein YdjX (TVP38/TMEM64 family)